MMNQFNAMELILHKISENDIAVFCNGLMSRAGYMINDRPGNFYMLASMGHAVMIGAGIAQNIESKVYVFDGDGNFFMNTGGPAMVGSEKIKNIVHVIFDNKIYWTTGGQATISENMDIAGIGRAFNYSYVNTIDDINDLKDEIEKIQNMDTGPVMLVVNVEIIDSDPSKIIPMSPMEITERLREKMKGMKNENRQ